MSKTLALNTNPLPTKNCLDLLVGGRLAALRHMSRLLSETNGIFTWENFGKTWETDHYYFKMGNINLMCETSIRQTHHFTNYRPRVPNANKSDRYSDYINDE